VELPSPYAGSIASVLVDEGATDEVGTPIVTIVTEGAEIAPAASAAPVSGADAGSGAVLVGYGTTGQPASRRRGRPAPQAEASDSEPEPVRVRELPTEPPTGVIAKPPIRKLAKDLDVDINKVTATGEFGE